MELNMKPKWILDKNSPEGIKECEVMKVEPEICDYGFETALCCKYELIYKTTPFLQTIKCINMTTFQDNGLVWLKEVFDTKEEALRRMRANINEHRKTL